MSGIKSPKKLIEVALPLDDINDACAKEGNPFTPRHPRSLHIWWARRRLAAARAVLFAQMVNDPGGERGYRAGLTKQQAAAKRERLFDIIRDLVKWENTNNEEVLERAREAIKESWRETCAMNKGKPGFDPDVLPAAHDPFAGGGAIPLEAQRFGLESYASDLNPVAVMINKAMIEIPPRFADSVPVGPIPATDDKQKDLLKKEWKGTEGLAEDIRRYGYWMREEAQKRIGHLYPEVEVTAEMAKDRPDLQQYVGKKLKVIAWLWARTVKSPNPAFSHVDVPLVSCFVLSKKKGKEAYVQPIIEGDTYRFEVKVGKPPKDAEKGTKASGRGADFYCLLSQTPISGKYVKQEGQNSKMGARMLAIVCEGVRGKIYLSPSALHENVACVDLPSWVPTSLLPEKALGFVVQLYGKKKWSDLFTNRQLVALNTFSDLVQEVRVKVIEDAKSAGMKDDGVGLANGGNGATAYGEALAVYFSLATSRWSEMSSNICSWNNKNQCIRAIFARQAISMTWDYAELSPFSKTGQWYSVVENIVALFSNLSCAPNGIVLQADAQTQAISAGKVISTDPPYYDNIGYADLSDFFYVWMRRNLKSIYPELFATMAVPKAEELVATPYRHGSKEKAEHFFLDGMTIAMHNLAEKAHPAFPVTIYYAFKSSDTDDSGTGNIGWETFLSAVLSAGFAITGTWPMRTERDGRMRDNSSNALASSIVLVCKKRSLDAIEVERREFLRELRATMPDALRDMMGTDGVSSPIAPVDLAQAAIGPGMEIFSKYKAVLNSDGSQMSVHEAMIEINRQIANYLSPEGSGFDAETLFCNDWFQQYGWSEGAYGSADVLARAKGSSVEKVKAAGIIRAEGGKVQLLNWQDYPENYNPETDTNRPTWEACHHMIRVLNRHGEKAAGELLAKMPGEGENIRQLAYFLYTLCERGGKAEEARYYNELMTSWHAIVAVSMECKNSCSLKQGALGV